MKKIFVAIFLIVSFLFGCCANNNAVRQTQVLEERYRTQQIIRHIEDATIAFQIIDVFGNPLTYCGGVWISKHKLITAKHCAQATLSDEILPDLLIIKSKIEFRLKSEIDTYNYPFVASSVKAHEAEIIFADSSSDLAILNVKENIDHTYVNINKSPLNIGDSVHIMGHTSGLLYSYLPGSISMFRLFNEADRNVKIIQIMSAAWKGNSGGGAFDSSGELIGICSFVRKDTPDMSFFVSYEEINYHITNNKINLD
ncbi:Trypsin-like peptidase domain containing protein [uncultured Caudovirales phage]|uniref:Trypsin-like peptidase domain containing protein n=1 Tax=uncultured Caudovirales phage TaxID=2100421 RepID=A0A6J5RT30_9CAUD|nr:Trypsin-like peptidase domain containing protein [uncultured Caudovirales phage]